MLCGRIRKTHASPYKRAIERALYSWYRITNDVLENVLAGLGERGTYYDPLTRRTVHRLYRELLPADKSDFYGKPFSLLFAEGFY